MYFRTNNEMNQTAPFHFKIHPGGRIEISLQRGPCLASHISYRFHATDPKRTECVYCGHIDFPYLIDKGNRYSRSRIIDDKLPSAIFIEYCARKRIINVELRKSIMKKMFIQVKNRRTIVTCF